MTQLVYGVDVSSIQHPGGAPIDWAGAIADLRARSGGADPFVMVKTTEGLGYINPYGLADIAGAQAHTPNVGAYDFDHPGDDPTLEVERFRAATPALKVRACDGEVSDKLTMAEVAQRIAQWLAAEPGDLLYSYPAFLDAMTGEPWGHPLWLADPNHPAGYPARPCLIQQYGQGPVVGISAPVDLNVWMGDPAAIDAFFAGTPAPGPTPQEDDVPPFLELDLAVKADGTPDDANLGHSYVLNTTTGAVAASPGAPFVPYGILGSDGNEYHFGPALNGGVFAYPGLPAAERQGSRTFTQIWRD